MPGGVSGLELARRARSEQPNLKVLLTSGYIGEEATAWASEYPMIDKPYEPPALAARIRSVLDVVAQKAVSGS